jgi:glutathione synthase/RimK-type ligase-like ATP-grasp enzyme
LVLVVTNRRDLTADWLILELERRGAGYVRFNTEDYPASTSLTWELDGPTTLSIGGAEHRLEPPLAIWYRRPLPPRLGDGLPGDAAEWAAGEAEAALTGVWRTRDAVWVNHPDANDRAGSKPEQLRTAARLGLDVPRSVVTDDPEAVRRLAAEVGGELVCKPLRSGHLSIDGEEGLFFTSRLTSLDGELDALGPEPYLFQELVPKLYDVRVTVIGEETFATRIESQSEQDARIDWRRVDAGRLEHRVEALPPEIAERCVALVRHYGLRFGAIDFAREPSGRYRFFELNPNGQWAWVEQFTGAPMRSCLADLLLQGDAALA